MRNKSQNCEICKLVIERKVRILRSKETGFHSVRSYLFSQQFSDNSNSYLLDNDEQLDAAVGAAVTENQIDTFRPIGSTIQTAL